MGVLVDVPPAWSRTMHRYAIGLAVGLSLTASAVGFAPVREEDREIVAARKEVLDVLKAVEEGKDDRALAARAEAIRKKGIELSELMAVYRLKEKGGLGYGEKPDRKSGIERKIIELRGTQKGPSKQTLEKEKQALIRLANVNVALAEIARPHFRKLPAVTSKKEWDALLDEQKEAAKELIQAVKKEDGKAAVRAAKKLLNACNECHTAPRH